MTQHLTYQEDIDPVSVQHINEKPDVLRLTNIANVNLCLWQRPKNDLVSEEVSTLSLFQLADQRPITRKTTFRRAVRQTT